MPYLQFVVIFVYNVKFQNIITQKISTNYNYAINTNGDNLSFKIVDNNNSYEYINGYFLADFIYSYHKGIDPITKMPLTLEQAEELASFTEVVAAHHTVNEFYTYPLHFTEYCNAAKDIVKMVREREKTDPRRN